MYLCPKYRIFVKYTLFAHLFLYKSVWTSSSCSTSSLLTFSPWCSNLILKIVIIKDNIILIES